MSSEYRTRNRGALFNKSASLTVSSSTGTPAPYLSTTTATIGSYDTMTDVVTRPFVPGITIANSPMESSRIDITHTPMSGSQQHNNATGYNRASGEEFVNRSSALALLRSQTAIDTKSLITQACTQALANVQKPEVAGLVTLAEFRSTVQSLLNPVNGALNWLKRNASPKQRTKRARARRKESIRLSKDIADQHLTIVFGLMPFISDIQGILKALQAIEPIPVRFTARGNASSQLRFPSAGSTISNDGNTKTTDRYNDSAVTQVNVRAYALYEATVTLQDALGLNLSQIPLTVFQTTPLSFVIDWFANVGNYISALTPEAGIRYISTGYTVESIFSFKSDYSRTLERVGAYGWSGSYTGGSLSHAEVVKQRVPSSLHAEIGLVLKQHAHREVLDTFKITAGLSLITQRLSKEFL